MNFACSSQKGCSRVPFEKSRFGPAEEIATNSIFHDRRTSNARSVASTFRLVCDPEHNFSARMMRRGLLLGCDRFTQRENLRHDWFDLSSVDQLRDLCQVFGIGMNGDTRSANPCFLISAGSGRATSDMTMPPFFTTP